MINNIFILMVSLAMVGRGATLATKYAGLLAESFRLSRYTVGFIIIAVISILPEGFISLTSALAGESAFGLGMLFGSNIADLTLVLAVIVLLVGRSLKVESKILKQHAVYPFVLLLPLILGLDGHYTRLEGLALVIIGVAFYYVALRDGVDGAIPLPPRNDKLKNVALLLLCMAVLLLGANFTVSSAIALAEGLGVSSILIGMLVVGLGTTLPELFFSLKSIQAKDDSLAVGDILGTVLADATVLVGMLALVSPFFFPKRIIYITGLFMVAASFMLFKYMRSGKSLTKREVVRMLAFWVFFVLVELMVNVGLGV